MKTDQWIKVTDRLPKKDEPVVVLNYFGWRGVAIIEGIGIGNEAYGKVFGLDDEEVDAIHYWLPLPELPKELTESWK